MSRKAGLSGWKLSLARILALGAAIAITVLAFVFREQARQLSAYGYPGIFLISLLANATLILPMPGIALTFAMGAVFNPFWVAIAAGLGSAIGELTGYLAGFSGEGILADHPTFERIKDWTARRGNWIILLLALIPNPLFDLAGMAAGVLRMSVPRFLFWTSLGKTGKMLLASYAGSASIDWLSTLFTR